jgi:hypothetical protein
MRSVRPSEVEEELAFAQRAAEYFAYHPQKTSFSDGDIAPDTFLALRWGLGEDCVLVLKLAEPWQHTPTNYQNIVPRRELPAAPAVDVPTDDIPF